MFQSIWVKLNHSLKQFRSGGGGFIFCFTQKRIPDFCPFFLENRGRKKNAFLVCLFFSSSQSCNRMTLPRSDHTSHSFWNSRPGWRLGLSIITGDEPARRETVKWRWFWVVKWLKVIKSDMSQSHWHCCLFHFLFLPAQPGKSLGGDICH